MMSLFLMVWDFTDVIYLSPTWHKGIRDVICKDPPMCFLDVLDILLGVYECDKNYKQYRVLCIPEYNQQLIGLKP